MTAVVHKPYCVSPPCNFKPLRNSPLMGSSSAASASSSSSSACSKTRQTFLPLRSALPTSFDDMYTPDILADKSQLTPEGRPKFTQRALVDWVQNDVRSLLIVSELRPEWRGRVPQIIEPGYRVQVLPLDASDEELVKGLVESDVYREQGFEKAFLVQTAEYTVHAARARSSSGKSQSAAAVMSRPEWRNVIENYVLNLACEAQCRIDFKRQCAQLKKAKRDAQSSSSSSSTTTTNTSLGRSTSPGKSTSPLLKKAILTSLSGSPDFPSSLESAAATATTPAAKPKKASLSRLEKQSIWVKVQTDLYKRLGLNWQPDELV